MGRLQQEKGMALLLVLVVIALLTSLLSEFAFTTLVDLRLTETFRDRTGAYYLAKGGVEAGRIMLLLDGNEYDHPSELWGQGIPSYPAGEGTVSVEIEDLSGRFNLNGIADNNGRFQRKAYNRFLELCNVVLGLSSTEADELAISLRDWLNADPQFTSNDDSYYLQQNPPYSRKAGDLDAVEELNLVRGFDADKVKQLRPFLRVSGDNKININTASAEMLWAWQFWEAQHSPVLDDSEIQEIIDYRDQQPLKRVADLDQVSGFNPNWHGAWINDDITFEGTLYRIRSEGQVNQGIRVAEAIVEKNKQANRVRLKSLRVE